MKILSKNIRWYARYASIPSMYRWVGTFIVLCLFVIIWWYYIYNSLSLRYASTKQEVMFMRTQLSIQQQLQDKIDQEQCIVKHAQKDFIDTISPMNHSIDVVRVIMACMPPLMIFLGYIPSYTQEKKWYTKHIIQVQLQGSFSDHLAMISSLQQKNSFVRCVRISFNKTEHAVCATYDFAYYINNKGNHESII